MIQVLPYLPEFLDGMWLTVRVSVLAFIGSLFLGTIGALARLSPVKILNFIAGIYVEAIRNTPALVQIFIIFFGLPAFGIVLPAFWAGVVALAVNAGAYNTEIIRAGIQAVPKGQLEAARTLGLTRFTTFMRVTFPQAMRTVYPPIINEFIAIILGTSLLSIIGLTELTSTAQIVNSLTFATIGAFSVSLVLYLVLTNLVSYLSVVFARTTFKPPLPGTTRKGRIGFLAGKKLLVRAQTANGGAQ